MKIIKEKKNIWIAIASIVGLTLLDQLTKWLAIVKLKGQEPFVIIANVFELNYLENESAAFGLDLITILQRIFKIQYFIDNPLAFLKLKMIFFVVITILVIILLFLLYLRIPKEKKFRYLDWIIIFFIAGAIGNLLDRGLRHYVVDFFYFKLINFPIFNVADIYVTVSAFCVIFLGLFYYKEADFEQIFPSRKK